jgi:hypothetical protein
MYIRFVKVINIISYYNLQYNNTSMLANRPPREPDWSQSSPYLRQPNKKRRLRDSRRRRRPDGARRHHSGYPASCRRLITGEVPATRTLPMLGAARAAATEAPTVATQGPLKGGQRGRWGRW